MMVNTDRPAGATAAGRPAAPASVNMALAEVDTPALLLDLDAFEVNLAQVHRRILTAGVAVRPHGKAHKCPGIARRQIAAGARGICCQKASEAEVFVDAGIDDIVITNQIVGAGKAARVARLARRARIGVCVDDMLQIEQMAAAARDHASRVDLLVEMDIGHGRCGVDSAGQAVALARRIAAWAPHVRFAGLHAFRGSAQHMRLPEERAAAVAAAVTRLRDVVADLAQAGFACETITGGGTGSYLHELDSKLYTEVQPGSYVLMDTDYAENRPDAGAPVLRQALFGWCTVISVRPTHAVLDGGLKAFAVDQGLPRLLLPGWRTGTLSDEHAVIVPEPGAAAVAVGDKVRLVPSHCDPTVNLHDHLIAIRRDRVADVWPVAARGALF